MHNFLETILSEKRREIAAAKLQQPLALLKERVSALPAALPFSDALRAHSHPAIIAEIKRASPSKGVIRADLDPVQTARSFADAGAACLSVLTDEKFFQGKLELIAQIKAEVDSIPVLRKDFICDLYQVWQTRAAQADAVLLIVAALERPLFHALLLESSAARLDVLIEVHTREELRIALEVISEACTSDSRIAYPLLGINNRNLKTFVANLDVTKDLIAWGRSRSQSFAVGLDALLVVAESGIRKGADLKHLSAYGAGAFLIGESLVATGDPGENLRTLITETQI